jgi:hypothetical protein
LVWPRFSDVWNYVEPFAGSLTCLLSRPTPFRGGETVNDYDELIFNFFRVVHTDPNAVAFHADWPVNEKDRHAQHAWLAGRRQGIRARLEGDPTCFDVEVAS